MNSRLHKIRDTLVSRTFTLSADVDEATAQAKYNNGVLELLLPKRVTAKAKSITIQ